MSICVSSPGSPEKPTVSVKDEVTSGDSVTATCTVLHSCPSDLPRVTWSHVGSHSSLSQPQSHDQWKVESYNLTFTPSSKDHDKNLSCSAEFRGKTVTGYKRLKVKCKSALSEFRTNQLSDTYTNVCLFLFAVNSSAD